MTRSRRELGFLLYAYCDFDAPTANQDLYHRKIVSRKTVSTDKKNRCDELGGADWHRRLSLTAESESKGLWWYVSGQRRHAIYYKISFSWSFISILLTALVTKMDSAPSPITVTLTKRGHKSQSSSQGHGTAGPVMPRYSSDDRSMLPLLRTGAPRPIYPKSPEKWTTQNRLWYTIH